jgi:hypothetical protein
VNSKLALPTALIGFSAYPSRRPDAQNQQRFRAKKRHHQHSELLKSLGFSAPKHAKTPVVVVSTYQGSCSESYGEVPLGFGNLPKNVRRFTAYRSLSS